MSKFFTPYKPRPEMEYPGGGKSMTQQHMRDECNINNIMSRYQQTGMIDRVNASKGFFGDVANLYGKDYSSLSDMITEVECSFMDLDAGVRRKFDNDPRKMIAFLSDPGNREEAKKLGLVEDVVGKKRHEEEKEDLRMAKAVQSGLEMAEKAKKEVKN